MFCADAVKARAMVMPADGQPDMPPLLTDLYAMGVPLMATVEHDVCPAYRHTAPIATRTNRNYNDCERRTARV